MDDDVITWLRAADPSVAWQVSRDLLGEPESVWGPIRARVETEGYGAALLAHQDPDGQWGGGAFFPSPFSQDEFEREGQPWTATHHAIGHLREFGLDPQSESARRTVALAGENARWDHAGQRFWDGEVEACINGRALAQAAYFGAPGEPILATLLADVLPDGAWNCDAERGAVVSSFDSTINVVEGLLEWELTHPEDARRIRPVRERGEEYLLERELFRRKSTGAVADPNFLQLTHPHFWQHTVLRALDHFRRASEAYGTPPDPRLATAIEEVRSRRLEDGRWPTDGRARGRVWLEIDGAAGEPSPWNTLVALRVLRWWDAGQPAGAEGVR